MTGLKLAQTGPNLSSTGGGYLAGAWVAMVLQGLKSNDSLVYGMLTAMPSETSYYDDKRASSHPLWHPLKLLLTDESPQDVTARSWSNMGTHFKGRQG